MTCDHRNGIHVDTNVQQTPRCGEPQPMSLLVVSNTCERSSLAEEVGVAITSEWAALLTD